jgi:hypothetical protein
MNEILISEVINQIQHDMEMGDTGALEEFLTLVLNGQSKKYFVGYLSEERANELGYDLKTIYSDENE